MEALGDGQGSHAIGQEECTIERRAGFAESRI